MKFEKSMKFTNKKRTICEVIREINDIINENTYDKDKMKGKIKEIHDMAKRMSKKLYAYKKDWDKNEYGINPDYEQDIKNRRGIV